MNQPEAICLALNDYGTGLYPVGCCEAAFLKLEDAQAHKANPNSRCVYAKDVSTAQGWEFGKGCGVECCEAEFATAAEAEAHEADPAGVQHIALKH